jgi:glycine cleavage system H lipoate-binding protein
MGLDDIAHKILGGVTRIELPKPGSRFGKGETIATIECGDRTCPIAAPLSGVVVDVNRVVETDPKWILREPYVAGWLFSVKPENDEYRKLRTGPEAKAWFQSEAHRLTGFLDQELGSAAADGGELIAPPSTLLPPEKWKELTGAFLSQN